VRAGQRREPRPARAHGPPGTILETVGLAIATAFDEPLVASLARMGPRAVVQHDKHPGKPIAGDTIVASCPLDLIFAEVLCDATILTHTPPKPGAADDTGGKPFANGVHAAHVEWQGKHDPKLWNWVRVTSPADATAEDVASSFPDEWPDGPHEAYRLAVSPPYFGLPFEIAERFDDAKRYSDVADDAAVAKGTAAPIAGAGAFHDSAVSDEAAIAQAPHPSASDLPPSDALERMRMQITSMRDGLSPWKLEDLLDRGTEFIMQRMLDRGKGPKTFARWSAVLVVAERTLHAASSELQGVLDEITPHLKAKTKGDADIDPSSAPGLEAVRQVLRAYARAASTSYLTADGGAALIEARRFRTLMPLAMAEERIGAARGAVHGQREAEADAEHLEDDADKTPGQVTDQIERAADLRLAAARGEKLDPDAVEKLTVDAGETELRARLLTLATQARTVKARAIPVGDPSQGDGWTVSDVADVVLKKVTAPEAVQDHFKNDRSGGGWIDRLDRSAKLDLAGRRKVMESVRADFVVFSEILDKDAWLKDSYERIRDAQVRDAILKMALQIGLSLLAGQAIGAIGAAVRGLALAGELGAEIRGASLLYQGTEIVAQATANTAIGGAMGGKAGVRELAENTLGIVLTNAALKPFEGLLAPTDEVEIRSWGQLAKRGGKLAASIAIEAGAGIGAAGIAHAMTHGGHMEAGASEEWITQGISIAATKFVHQHTVAMRDRITVAMHELGAKPELGGLHERVVALTARSAPARNKEPTAEEALAQLTERRTLLGQERTFYQNDPKARAALADNTKEMNALGPQFADVPLQLAHLSPVVDGHIYEGRSSRFSTATPRRSISRRSGCCARMVRSAGS
jgi:hypothetical protein